MALSEEQIVRYSRQLLLDEVGGKGQERLRGSGVSLSGSGSAQATAVAYLAAGGCPMNFSNRTVEVGEVGFLIEPQDVGKPQRVALVASLRDANPDALVSGGGELGRLGELPASFAGPPPWVALGWSGRRGAVVYRAEQGCAACFIENASLLSNGPATAASVLLGAVAALAYQRIVLGLSADLGGVWLDEDGTLSPLEVKKCQSHR